MPRPCPSRWPTVGIELSPTSLPSPRVRRCSGRASGIRPGSGLSIRIPSWSTSSLAPCTSSTATTGLLRQLSGTGFLALIVPAEQLRLTAFHRVVLDGAQDSGWLLRRLQEMGIRAAGRVEPAPGGVCHRRRRLVHAAAAQRRREGAGRRRVDASPIAPPRLGAASRAGEDCMPVGWRRSPPLAGLEGLTAGCDGRFALAPPSIEDVLAVADRGETLPAKTTYGRLSKPLAGLVVIIRAAERQRRRPTADHGVYFRSATDGRLAKWAVRPFFYKSNDRDRHGHGETDTDNRYIWHKSLPTTSPLTVSNSMTSSSAACGGPGVARGGRRRGGQSRPALRGVAGPVGACSTRSRTYRGHTGSK